jgi:hypothetical protein
MEYFDNDAWNDCVPFLSQQAIVNLGRSGLIDETLPHYSSCIRRLAAYSSNPAQDSLTRRERILRLTYMAEVLVPEDLRGDASINHVLAYCNEQASLLKVATADQAEEDETEDEDESIF